MMKKLMILSLIIIAALGGVAKAGESGFKWKSSSLFPNGTVVQACVGDNVTLPWAFDMTSRKQFVIQWSKTPKNNPDVPVITSYEFHAFILPERVYNSATGQWHVELGCRPPVTRGQSALPVIWTTPSNRIAINTAYKNNTFILELPLPLEEGDYSCSLNRSVPAVKCLSTLLNTSRAATVSVKGVNTRLSYLERCVETLWNETADLNVSLCHLTDIIQHLKAKDKKFDEDIKLNQAREKNNTVLQNVHTNEKRTSKINFLESVPTAADNCVQSKCDDVIAMVQRNNDDITAMVRSKFDSITAMVQSKFDNIRAIILQLQSDLTQLVNSDSEKRPASCFDVQNCKIVSGIHTIFVNDNSPVKVYCDQTTDNGGWTVIQRRQDGSVDFYRNWEQYEKGFGDPNGEFWIGLANLHLLTKTKNVTLRVDLADFSGSTAYAVFNTFAISGADDKYRIKIGGYSGTAGDSLSDHNASQFSTYDRDHDRAISNCAEWLHGAWWYGACTGANLNGLYLSNGYGAITWTAWENNRPLKRVEMKIKQRTLN